MSLFSGPNKGNSDMSHETHKPRESNSAFGERIRDLVDAGYEVKIVSASSNKESGEITLSIK